MKRIALSLWMLFLLNSISAQTHRNTVNPIIGDESFIATFGTAPQEDTDERLRVQTHLSYVEQKLRERPVDGLNDQQKKNRAMVLDLLHEYWTNGVYPSNFDYPEERKPCFIDKNGTICAVGYLIEKTAGMDLAQQINEKHQYDNLADMNEPVIAAWAEEHGFTMEECAVIQPTYGPVVPNPGDIYQQPIKTGYGISSGLVGGLNIAINTVNLSGRFGNTKAVSYLGFISGGAQLFMGIANIRQDKTEWGMYTTRATTYKAQNNLSYINIAMGTTTMVTSALNLIINNKIKNKKNAVGLYSYPGLNNEMNMGFTLARRL